MLRRTSVRLVLLSLQTVFVVFLNNSVSAANPCKSIDYFGNTLKLVKEQAIADSFVDSSAYGEAEKVPNRFEASDVVLSRDGHVMYIVFDNSYHIGSVCTALGRSSNCTDRLLEWPVAALSKKKSGFEGIAYNPVSGNHFVVQEAVATATKNVFQANVFEVSIDARASSPIRVVESCLVNWNFGSENKGLEGLEVAFHRGSGKTYLLGLCEANKCDHTSNSKNDGRIMALEKKEATANKPCSWEPVGTFDLPSSVYFDDYSGISIYHRESLGMPTYVAVTSQENSQVWVGTIEEVDQAPFFDLVPLHKPSVYDLPRTTETPADCQIKYCNVEGVAWRAKNQLILVSDKAKDDQDVNCIEKDQSVHYVALPEHLTD